jgi:Tetratricopeptide repeat
VTTDDIATMITSLGDLVTVLRDADPTDKAHAYRQLGLQLTYQPDQRVVIADARHQRSCTKVSEGDTDGPDHPQVASTLTNLGTVQADLGELPAARTTLERALTINEAVYGPDHPHTVQARRLVNGL